MKNKMFQVLFTTLLTAMLITAAGIDSIAVVSALSVGAGVLSYFVVVPGAVLGEGIVVTAKSKELRERAGKIIADMRAITDQETITKEDEAKWDKLNDEYEQLIRHAEMIEKTAKENAEKRNNLGQSRILGGEETVDPKEVEQRYVNAFVKYVQYGFGSLEADERKLVRERFIGDKRAQSTTTTEGGYTIPEGFSGELEKMMAYYGGMLEAARIFPTASGNAIPWPTLDDTANKGKLLGEGGDATTDANDMVFGTKTLNAYKFSSDLLLVSSELLQDSAFNFDQVLGEALAERIGRILNQYLTTGTGSSQPHGVVTASAKGADAAAAAITFDNLIDLFHGVNSVYRRNGIWMFNDNTLKALRKLKDGENRYVWQMGDVRTGEPATLLGKPYIVNDDMADIGAAAKSVIFGDFSKYIIRRVNGIALKRADERYVETDQVAFVAFARYDGELINTNAVKHLLHAAS